jgi:uncharacterized OsmC-like protein
MTDLTFNIEAQRQSATKTIVKARNFELIIDEPQSLGGTDHGANPVEYLLASYAGCLSVVAHITAKERGIRLDDLKINISGNLNPARFMGVSEKERAGFKNISVEIIVKTELNTADKTEWIKEIINRCPVGDNLKHLTEVDIAICKQEFEVTTF